MSSDTAVGDVMVVSTFTIVLREHVTMPESHGVAHDIDGKTLHVRRGYHLPIRPLNTPMQVLLQIRLQHAWFERAESRVGREPRVEMHEAFRRHVLLPFTVLALRGGAVDERVVRSDVGAARAPFPRVFGEVSDEDDHGEAPTELVFLRLDPSDPVV